jgi:ribosomal-protein-alanine N-acetyltransferase
LVTAHAFSDLKLHRLEAGVMPRNTASTRVLEKAGYLREGLMKQNMLVNGTWEDHWHFAQVNPVD